MKRIFSVVTASAAVFTVILALTTCIDVVGRYVFNSPLQGAYELTGNFFCIIAACGIAAVAFADEHISVDSIFNRLSPLGQRILTLINTFFGLVVFLVLCWQGIVSVHESMFPSYETTSGILPIVTFPFRIILALAFFLSAIALFYAIIRPSHSKTNDKTQS